MTLHDSIVNSSSATLEHIKKILKESLKEGEVHASLQNGGLDELILQFDLLLSLKFRLQKVDQFSNEYENIASQVLSSCCTASSECGSIRAVIDSY